MIPESNKLQTSEKEQITVINDAYISTVKLHPMEPDYSNHSVAVQHTTDKENHGYVISVSILLSGTDFEIQFKDCVNF